MGFWSELRPNIVRCHGYVRPPNAADLLNDRRESGHSRRHTEILSTMFFLISALPAVVKVGGARVGMAGQVLHVFARHVLLQ